MVLYLSKSELQLKSSELQLKSSARAPWHAQRLIRAFVAKVFRQAELIQPAYLGS